MPELNFSVSCTTREKRSGEVEGRDYYFISVAEFKAKIQNNEFAEYEEVYPGKFYGTLKSEIERIWNLRKVAIFDIDVKGAQNLKNQYAANCLSIFIQPPSKEVLINRLKLRGSEDEMSLKERIKRSEEELAYAGKFDKIVLNRDFDTAYMRTKNFVISYLETQTVHIE